MHFRISSKDGRCGHARPIALIDRDSNALISSYRNHADAAKAMYLMEAIAPYGYGMTAPELNDVVTEQMTTLYATSDIGQLTLGKYNSLVRAVRLELQSRRKRP